MDTLPRHIPTVDGKWKPLGPTSTWHRVSADDKALLEEHVDALVCAHVDAIAESLHAAGVIEAGTKLLVLGTQVDNVDVVLAEIDLDDTFQRLVLVESKLFRNPQAKRSVLAQLLDYGHVAQGSWPKASLPALFKKADKEWLEENSADIVESLRLGETLLLIVCDRVDRNLSKLARRFVAQADPLNLNELAIVSLALYGRGNERLVIPHVVSAVELAERNMCIKVTVQTEAGVSLRADVRVDEKEDELAESGRAGGGAGPSITEEKFLADVAGLPEGETFVGVARSLLASAREAGLDVRWRPASFSLYSGTGPDAVGLLGVEHKEKMNYVEVGVRRWHVSTAKNRRVDKVVAEVMGTGNSRLTPQGNGHTFRLEELRGKEERLVAGLANIVAPSSG